MIFIVFRLWSFPLPFTHHHYVQFGVQNYPREPWRRGASHLPSFVHPNTLGCMQNLCRDFWINARNGFLILGWREQPEIAHESGRVPVFFVFFFFSSEYMLLPGNSLATLNTMVILSTSESLAKGSRTVHLSISSSCSSFTSTFFSSQCSRNNDYTPAHVCHETLSRSRQSYREREFPP